MLKIPAASAAPVPPAHTSASARPSATARAALTIEASGVVRAAFTGSGAFAIETGESSTSTPAGSAPRLSAGPNSSTRTPRSAASAAPAATSPGPRSAPLQSTATTGCRSPGAAPCGRAGRQRPSRSGMLVIVLVIGCGRAHDLAPGVEAADRADPVGTAGVVALGAGVDRRSVDPVLGAPLGGAAVRLLFLWYRHRSEEGYQQPPVRYSSRSSRSFAQRGSGACS